MSAWTLLKPPYTFTLGSSFDVRRLPQRISKLPGEFGYSLLPNNTYAVAIEKTLTCGETYTADEPLLIVGQQLALGATIVVLESNATLPKNWTMVNV